MDGHAWDWRPTLAALQRFILARLGYTEAIVVHETAELKHGDRRMSVAGQHTGITGQMQNFQTVVFAAYVTARRILYPTSGSTCRNSGAGTSRGGSGRTSGTKWNSLPSQRWVRPPWARS